MVDQKAVQSNGRTVEENGNRLLAVLYSLSGGAVGVPVRKQDIFAECERLGVFKMTDDEFEAYKAKTIADAHVLDAVEVG